MKKTLKKIAVVTSLFLVFSGAVASAQQFEPQDFVDEAEIGSEVQMQPVSQTTSEEVRARVIEIKERDEQNGIQQIVFVAESKDGERFEVDTSTSYTEGLRYNLKKGSVIYLQVLRDVQTNEVEQAFLADVRRTTAIGWMAVLFAIIILSVGWMRGLSAMAGLAITIAIVFLFILPQILQGSDAVLITVIGSMVILAVNMHLSHGFKRSTALAYASTLIGLALVYVFGTWFTSLANLSGLASEESILLYFHAQQIIVPKGVLLAGIILGAVGVLDDIAITQSETVAEIAEANPALSRAELFTRAMRVGRHHIASTINTLVLAYAGVALPLLLLFMVVGEVSIWRFINEEPVAEEIIRTLAGTLALVLTVPIATWFATFQKKS